MPDFNTNEYIKNNSSVITGVVLVIIIIVILSGFISSRNQNNNAVAGKKAVSQTQNNTLNRTLTALSSPKFKGFTIKYPDGWSVFPNYNKIVKTELDYNICKVRDCIFISTNLPSINLKGNNIITKTNHFKISGLPVTETTKTTNSSQASIILEDMITFDQPSISTPAATRQFLLYGSNDLKGTYKTMMIQMLGTFQFTN